MKKSPGEEKEIDNLRERMSSHDITQEDNSEEEPY